MDAIRLRQIDEALGYDKHMNAMVFNMEKKRVAQTIREMPRDDYALIDAQKMMDANDAVNATQSMLNGKFGQLSILTHHGVRIDNQQFVSATKDVWEVESVVSKYNAISAPFMSANGATALQQNILRRAQELLRPVGAIKNGLNKVINSITRMARDRDDSDPLMPTVTLYFVRLIETLAAYIMLYEHLASSRLLPITPSDLTTRVWDVINHKKAWKDIAGGENVANLFREFEFAAPPEHPPPERPPPLDSRGGTGPLPRIQEGRAATKQEAGTKKTVALRRDDPVS